MKRRILAAALAVAMVVACFAACEGTPSSSVAEPESSTPVDDVSEPEDEVSSDVEEGGTTYTKFDDVVLSALSCWNGSAVACQDQYNSATAAAIRDVVGVTVEWEGLMMNETEKLNLMFASGDIPDVVSAPHWGGSGGETGVIKKAATEGMLYDLTDVVMEYEWLAKGYEGGVAISQPYLENDIDYPAYNGRRYVLPQDAYTANPLSITNWGYGVFVRGDVPEALGIDATEVRTSEDLYNFMKAAQEYGFKDVNGNDCIVATTYHSGWDLSGYLTPFADKTLNGSFIMNEDGTVGYRTLTENWVERHMWVWKLVQEGILDVECFTCTDEQATEKVGNGTALFFSAQYNSGVSSMNQTGLHLTNPEMVYTWVGPLNYRDGTQAANQNEQAGRAGTPVLFFPADIEDIHTALTYYDYVNSPEGMAVATYGVEGEDWNYNEEGQPRISEYNLNLYKTDPEGYDEYVNERGIGTFLKIICDHRMEWFGETGPLYSVAEKTPQDLINDEYRYEIKPVAFMSGYGIGNFASNYENYETITENILSSEESDITNMAYFAATEEEARKLLTDYQEKLKTFEDGMIYDYLDYIAECAAARQEEHGDIFFDVPVE